MINTVGCLYKLDFPNGKSYIGITKNTANKRFLGHARKAGKTSCAVHHAIHKYGKDAVEVKTLVVAEYEYILSLEKAAILAYKTKVPNGYNLTDGGDGITGYKFTDEVRAKMSLSKKGKLKTEEHKAKISAAHIGKKMSRDAIDKKIASTIGWKHTKEAIERIRDGNLGRKASAETVEKIRKANLGLVKSVETREKISNAAKARYASKEFREKLLDIKLKRLAK